MQAQQQSCFDSQGQEEGDSSSESQQQFVSWEMNNTGVIASDVITLHSAMTIKYSNIFFTPSRYHRFPRRQAGSSARLSCGRSSLRHWGEIPISLKIALARGTNVKECIAVERTGSEPPDEAPHSLVDVCERIQPRRTHHRGCVALRFFLDLGCQLC